MQCTVSWAGRIGSQSSKILLAETGSGHSLIMDTSAENGGANLAARPMEMLLCGAGGCTTFDVVMILQRGRQQIYGCTVSIEADRAEHDPKIFTRIHMHFTVMGKNLDPKTVERAIALSHEKYCSATIMLAKTAEITTEFSIVDADAPQGA